MVELLIYKKIIIETIKDILILIDVSKKKKKNNNKELLMNIYIYFSIKIIHLKELLRSSYILNSIWIYDSFD